MDKRSCIYCKYYEQAIGEEPCNQCYDTCDKPNFTSKRTPVEPVGCAQVDMVNEPPHYKQGGMETIDEMILIFGKEAVANFCICNAWKYRARALYKNQDEDMKKSHWYINKYKELMGV